jgi:hypothetical protein
MCDSEGGDELHSVEPGERVRHLQQGGQLCQQARPHHPVQVLLTGKKEKDFNILQCSGSGMLIPDPESRFLPIPDRGSRIQKQQQKRGVKKFSCHTFLCSHKFHKIENYFSFEVLKKKIWANFQRIILFT